MIIATRLVRPLRLAEPYLSLDLVSPFRLAAMSMSAGPSRPRGVNCRAVSLKGVAFALSLAAFSMAQERVAPLTDSLALTLEAALHEAQAKNPSLLALRRGLLVATAEVRTAGERPNPDISYEAAKETPRDALVLSLPIETASKRERRVVAAKASLDVSRAEVLKAEADVRMAVRRAFHTLLAAGLRKEAASDLLEMSRRAAAAAQARYEAGAVPRLDVLQAGLDLTLAENAFATLQGDERASRAEFNVLLGRSANLASRAEGDLYAAAPAALDLTGLNLGESVDLVASDRKISEALARIALARALQRPDLTVSGALTHRALPEFNYGWRASVALSLPIFTSHGGAVEREVEAHAQAQAEREALFAAKDGGLRAAAIRVDTLRQQLERELKTVQPSAREMRNLAEESYAAGQTGIVALLQALKTAREVGLQVVETGLSYQLALAELERALGRSIP